MKRIFILEDNKWRIQIFKNKFINCELVIVETAKDAIELLSKDLNWDMLFLDHDLGGEVFVNTEVENCGTRVAKYLHDKEIKGNIYIHSMNYYGAKSMASYLPKAKVIPFPFIFGNVNE